MGIFLFGLLSLLSIQGLTGEFVADENLHDIDKQMKELKPVSDESLKEVNKKTMKELEPVADENLKDMSNKIMKELEFVEAESLKDMNTKIMKELEFVEDESLNDTEKKIMKQLEPAVAEIIRMLTILEKYPTEMPDLESFTCMSAVRSAGRVAMQGWALVQKRAKIINKAREDRELCAQREATPDLQKCLDEVDKFKQREQTLLTSEIWDVAPYIVSALHGIMVQIVAENNSEPPAVICECAEYSHRSNTRASLTLRLSLVKGEYQQAVATLQQAYIMRRLLQLLFP